MAMEVFSLARSSLSQMPPANQQALTLAVLAAALQLSILAHAAKRKLWVSHLENVLWPSKAGCRESCGGGGVSPHSKLPWHHLTLVGLQTLQVPGTARHTRSVWLFPS